MDQLQKGIEKKQWKAVMRLLRDHGGLSRMELAEYLGLTRSAVTPLINWMLTEGLIVEQGELPPQDKPRRGRRRIQLQINENSRLVFGAAVEGQTVFLGLTNLHGQTLDRVRLPLADNYRGILEQIVETVRRLTQENYLPADHILGLGISLSISGEKWIEGTAYPEKLARLQRDLSRGVTLPLSAVRVSEGAALAQMYFSEAPEDFFLLRYGVHPESAVIANRQVYRGHRGYAGLLTSDAGMEMGTLVSQLQTAVNVLDPAQLFVFGGLLETDAGMAELDELFGGRSLLARAMVTDETLYLCGCAAAVADFFSH